jgi:hypothetical protein
MWYPNKALYHAQLAWVLHLAGEPDMARQEADKAHDLDQKMPHKEQRLNQQHVFDPYPSQPEKSPYRQETAEQTVERLRSPSAEEKL